MWTKGLPLLWPRGGEEGNIEQAKGIICNIKLLEDGLHEGEDVEWAENKPLLKDRLGEEMELAKGIPLLEDGGK